MAEVRIEITAAFGGPEPQAWADMLLKMYVRWAAKHGYVVAPGREVKRSEFGIERATIELSGDGVERLHGEEGVHRLVRFSPFDIQERRHTSFALVKVTPLVEGHMVASVPWRNRVPGVWEGQIRSYVLDPYKIVKDLRTAVERSDVDAVLDGDIDGFLDAAVAQGLPRDWDDADGAAVMDAAQ